MKPRGNQTRHPIISHVCLNRNEVSEAPLELGGKMTHLLLFNKEKQRRYVGVEPKIGGKPPKWMVYNGKPYEQMDDLGVPLFLETPM